ncbi:MAG: pyruvate dehydrogenase (acetyl-transferring) E1 component subunit alpha [Candidatus Woesearchaeota archaeon]|nr:MAG: pyruvate dehydrogenase (acetyl-transferring) E1 component subunit alpha [Candidatus Woesearchaeota archaeon]
MQKTIAKFEVSYLQILDETGKIDSNLMPKLSNDDIKKLYELMVITRIADDKALKLQRQGRIGTYAESKGQEASQVGSAYALKKEDFVFPSFRELGMFVTRNFPLEQYYQYFGWDERGNKIPENQNIFPIAIPVGTQTIHAVGFALGIKLKKEKKTVITYFGDGATSEGDFHEAMNFAGVFQLPLVFLCQNNQYAISVPRSLQSHSETLAQKAIAYGFDGIQVDGNDIFAVYKATSEALEKARQGKGPTLIECLTYRMGNHTTADDASRYRTEKEVKEWQKKDPIDRLKKYMQAKKLWSESYEKEITKKAEELVNKAVEKAESLGIPPVEDMFKYMFKEMPPELKEQLEELKNE